MECVKTHVFLITEYILSDNGVREDTRVPNYGAILSDTLFTLL